MSETPLLGLPLMESSQAQKHVTHNEALLLLDAAIHLSALSRAVAVPPAAPAEGDRYLVAAAATGIWAARDGELAIRDTGSWRFVTPRNGWRLWVQDEAKLLVFDGIIWRDVQNVNELSEVSLMGVNTTADTGNRLSVASSGVLFSHAGTDHRLKVNKQAAANTASLLYQTNYSGRAELGLAGDDDFHVKVSADGSAWNEAIVVDRATGAVTLPNTPPGNISDGDKGDIRVDEAGAAWLFERTGGAVGDGVADDTAALQSVLTAGKTVLLGHGKSYRITQRLNITADGTGITGDGSSRIIMSASAGHFDNTSSVSADRYGIRGCGIYAEAVAAPVVKGFYIAPSAYADGRRVKALSFKSCTDITAENIDASGFSIPGGVMVFNGCTRGSVSFNRVHSCTSNDAGGGQITGISFDADTAADSAYVEVAGNRIWDLTAGAAFIAAVGFNTTGIHIEGRTANNIQLTANWISNVGQGVDCYGNNNLIAGNQFTSIYTFAVALKHGASANVVTGNTIDGAGTNGIRIEGSGSVNTTKNLTDNLVTANTVRGINFNGQGGGSNAGIAFVSGALFNPVNNRISGNLVDCGGTGSYGLYSNNAAGTGNEIDNNRVSGAATADYALASGTYLYLRRTTIAANSFLANNQPTDKYPQELSAAQMRAALLPAGSGDVAADAAGETQLLWRHDLINLVANPYFELGDFGFSKQTGWTIEQDAANARAGNWVAKRVGSGGPLDIRALNYSAILPGEKIHAEAWVKTSAAPAITILRVAVRWFDKDKVFLSNSNGANVAGDLPAYTLTSVVATAPANAAYCSIAVQCTMTAGTVWADTLFACRLRDGAKLLAEATIPSALLGGDITAAGKALLDDADAAAQRLTLGLGSAALQDSSAFAAVAHGHAGLAPAGGSTGQVLKKNSATDHDYGWAADATGGGGGISSASAALAADVALTSSNTWYDGPSVTLAAGTWLVLGTISHWRTVTATAAVFGRISDGSNHFASTQFYHTSVAGTGYGMALAAIITLGAETVIKVQAATSSGSASSFMKAALNTNGSGNNSTQINAIKIG